MHYFLLLPRIKDLDQIVKLALDFAKYHHKFDPYFAYKSDISKIYRENFIKSIYSTKVTLSKIISKLHSRKILSRIKVGKVNKIYLGDKIEKGKLEENLSEE